MVSFFNLYHSKNAKFSVVSFSNCKYMKTYFKLPNNTYGFESIFLFLEEF